MPSATHTPAGYTHCVDALTIEDSCYARELQAAGLSWSPPQSCGAVNEYEVRAIYKLHL